MEALDFSSEVEVSSEATRSTKRPRKKKKTEDLSGSASAHGNASVFDHVHSAGSHVTFPTVFTVSICAV